MNEDAEKLRAALEADGLRLHERLYEDWRRMNEPLRITQGGWVYELKLSDTVTSTDSQGQFISVVLPDAEPPAPAPEPRDEFYHLGG